MNTASKLIDFENKLESAIKNIFESYFTEEDEFEISADYDTHCRIEELVKKFGLSVYGMTITPSEFTITFEIESLFDILISKYKPKFISISLENDGNYYLTVTKDSLIKDWHLSITDSYFFNLSKIPPAELEITLNEMEQVLMVKLLSK